VQFYLKCLKKKQSETNNKENRGQLFVGLQAITDLPNERFSISDFRSWIGRRLPCLKPEHE